MCAPGADLSEGFKGTVRAGTGPRGRGAGGVAGGACFSRRRCRRREPLVRHWVVLQRMRSRVVRAWTICTVRRSPAWVRFCMVGLNVGSEAGGISPEISPAWAVYTAGGVSTSAIINSIPDVRSATFKGVRPSGGPNQVWREAAAHQRAGGRAKKNGACAGRPRMQGLDC